MKSKVYQYVIIFVLLLSLNGCGGGAPDGSMSNVAGGGIGGTGITSIGPITALGKSITVNGIKYEIDNSQVFIGNKDHGKDTSVLKLGMVVTVRGIVNSDGITGRANVVNFDANVEGSITSIDLIANTFILLGQTIVVDDKTVFEMNNQIIISGLSGLTVSDYVEVSGLVGLNGNILATRVEKKTAEEELELKEEVKGMVKNLNSLSMTFSINDLLIDYSNAVLEGFKITPIANGDFVQVKGIIDMDTGVFNAASVEKENLVEVENENGSEFKLSGFVSSVDKNQLVLLTASGTITIQMKETTKFDNGTIINLLVGVKIEVEGESIDGVMTVNEISFSDDHNGDDGGGVELVDTEIEGSLDETPSNTTTLKISGITVDTSEAVFENEHDVKIDRLTFFSTLSAGTFVKVKGSMTGIDTLKATKVSKKKNDD